MHGETLREIHRDTEKVKRDAEKVKRDAVQRGLKSEKPPFFGFNAYTPFWLYPNLTD